MSNDPHPYFGAQQPYSPYAPPSFDGRTPPLPTPASPERKVSILGIASFALSIIAGLGLIATIGTAGFIESSTPGGMDEESNTAVIIGLCLFGFMFVAMIGFGLGIGGLYQPNRDRVFSILGIIFSSLSILGTIGLIGLGMMMG